MTLNYPSLTLPVGGRTQVTEDNLSSERKSARPTYQSDPALIQACLDGRQPAWDDLVDRYGRLVYSIARGYGFSAADADDIFQNVFTIVFRRLESLRDQTRLSAWLIIITQHECQRLYRRNVPEAELDEMLADTRTSVSEPVRHWENHRLVHAALGQLDTRSQQLLTALFLDPVRPSYEELANRLGMAVGSIAPTRTRCLKKLEVILMAMGAEVDF